MGRKSISNIIFDNNLEPLLTEAKEGIYSVFFNGESNKAMLVNTSVLYGASLNELNNQSNPVDYFSAFRVLPADDANKFLKYIGQSCSTNNNLKIETEKFAQFYAFAPKTDPRDVYYNFKVNLNEDNSITIKEDFLPPITFDKDGRIAETCLEN